MSAPAPVAHPRSVRRLDTPAARELAGLCATFEDLQTVLQCCERLVPAPPPEVSGGPVAGSTPPDVVVDALWTMALISYARSFTPVPDDQGGAAVDETPGRLEPASVAEAQPGAEEWHALLLRLAAHVSAPLNHREVFSVGVAQGEDGSVEGLAVTSIRQPLVDEVTVRQTGALALALSSLVNARIAAAEASLMESLTEVSVDDLALLEVLDLAPPADGEG